VAPIQDVRLHEAQCSFDCVILNGVFGFGVNDTDEMRTTVKAIHAVLRPGGLLVLGWNTSRHAPPDSLHVLEPFFSASGKPPWGAEKRFPSETHIYNFYTRQPDA
jgi:SAM-dependent methyltransferase